MHRFFFHLLILFFPVQLGYHFWPEWSMVLGRRVDYLSPTLFFTDILIGLTLLFWIFEKPRAFPLRHIKVTLFVFIFAVVNIVLSTSRPVAIYHWIKFVEFGLLGYYIVKTKPNIQYVIYCLLFTVLYSSLIAIFQFIFQHSIGGPLRFLGERTFTIDTPGIARIVIVGKEWLRPYATFPHPNVLGGYIATVLLLLISELRKKIYAPVIVLGIVALVLTFSRSAWIVAALGIGWVVFRNNRFIFFVLVACLLFLVAFSFHPLDESVFVRQQLHVSARNIFQSSPFFGVGLGNFLVALPFHLPSRTIYFLQPVHNIYLLILAETGVIGLIGIIWFIFKRIKLSVALAGLLFLGFVDHYPFTLQQGRLLLTILIALYYRAPH